MTPAVAPDAQQELPTQSPSGASKEDALARFMLVCVGGAIGSGARYLVASWAANAWPMTVPVGTAIVNVVGSWFIAVVMDLSLRAAVISPDMRLFLATGVAGGFTTYSAFNHETLHLLEERALLLALAYMAGMIFLCLAAGLLGLATSRIISGALSGFFTGGWR
jgi:fluoride exporter